MPVGGFVPPTWGQIVWIMFVLLLFIGVPVGLIIWAAVEIIEVMK